MIVLGTTVVSELMRGREADTGVVAWLWGLRELGATLATHNIDDFAGLGLSLVNPWETSPT
jgi:hypothetical protein